jgi:hypothetical protein
VRHSPNVSSRAPFKREEQYIRRLLEDRNQQPAPPTQLRAGLFHEVHQAARARLPSLRRFDHSESSLSFSLIILKQYRFAFGRLTQEGFPVNLGRRRATNGANSNDLESGEAENGIRLANV